MIDIQFVREHANLVKETIKKKFQAYKLKLVDEVIAKDEKWRALKTEADKLRSERNKLSREIGEAKKAGKNPASLLQRAQSIPDEITRIETQSDALYSDIQRIIMKLPNEMHSSVPVGKDAGENVVLKIIGKPKTLKFEVRNHAELAELLKLADFDASARTSGNGFYYIQGELALLNQALIRFALETMVKKGYTYVETPLMLRGEVIKSVTDLQDVQNQIYKIEGEDLYLIGTSEHALIGRYYDTILSEKQLPLKQTSYSMCFRKEIGSHGIDEKGLFRTHQFNKMEMVVICKSSESMKHYNDMQKITIDMFKQLGIPIRVLAICSGDLGDLKHAQVDIEAWSPRTHSYFEVGSCSNLTDAQARRLKIRCDGSQGRYVPHTLNNTAIATSRALVAILENYQQKDGTVKVPTVLHKYMFGTKVLGKKK
ncbi:MAG: serine--tRNA ligase [Nanoarchaeota archaeon]